MPLVESPSIILPWLAYLLSFTSNSPPSRLKYSASFSTFTSAASSLYPSTLLPSPPPPPISNLLELRNLSNTKRSGE
ncbi:unnamed protein product [Lactuca saligna]|uniref:Uncharacterized protein n=1 Tax=Lactuca saligna TaxID=75948 RepID=A0AA35ZWT0_LACSI|nr:unnamed protein product [Lactuca saligna]